MSRIGVRPITIPSGTTVTQTESILEFQGSKGQLSLTVHPRLAVAVTNESIAVERHSNDRFARSLHGLQRMLIANAVEGVSTGFTKRLEMHGVGYRAQTNGSTLTLTVGFTHPVIIEAPEGITFTVDRTNIISVQGIDKQRVGQVAANIRAVRKPEPYKGKGIRYVGEQVRRKAGKAAKTGK